LEAPTSGYYLNAAVTGTNTNALIHCDTGCQASTATSGYYLNAAVTGTNTNALIHCDTGCQASTAATYGAYINAAVANHIITCTAGGCEAVTDNTIKGYYLNSAETPSKSVISCDGSTPCSEQTDPTEYVVGKIKVTTDAVKLCLEVGCSGLTGEVAFAKSGMSVYKSLTVADSVFPGVTPGATISVKVSNGSILLLQDTTGLPTCGGSCSQDIYCIDGSTKKIKTKNTSDTTCVEITSTTVTSPIFFDSTYHIVNPDQAIFGYQCPFAAGGALSGGCTLIRGYVKTNEGVVRCSGWKGENCEVVVPSACTAADEGKMGTDNKICLGSKGVPLPESGTSNVAFQTSNVNLNYGQSGSSIVYLTLTPDSATVSTPAGTI